MWNLPPDRFAFFLLFKFSGLKMRRVVALRVGSDVDKFGIRYVRRWMELNDFHGLGRAFRSTKLAVD